jgi:hypothetical protein
LESLLLLLLELRRQLQLLRLELCGGCSWSRCGV